MLSKLREAGFYVIGPGIATTAVGAFELVGYSKHRQAEERRLEEFKPAPDRLGTDCARARALLLDTSGQSFESMWRMHQIADLDGCRGVDRYFTYMIGQLSENITADDPAVVALVHSLEVYGPKMKPHLAAAEEVANLFDFVANEIENKDVDGSQSLRPRETLAKKQGECKRKSLLLASMLEAAGYATRVLTTPTHIGLGVFIPFDASTRSDVYLGVEEVYDYLHERYRTGFSMHEDREDGRTDGFWLLLDPTLEEKQGMRKVPGYAKYLDFSASLVYDVKTRQVLDRAGGLVAQK